MKGAVVPQGGKMKGKGKDYMAVAAVAVPAVAAET